MHKTSNPNINQPRSVLKHVLDTFGPNALWDSKSMMQTLDTFQYQQAVTFRAAERLCANLRKQHDDDLFHMKRSKQVHGDAAILACRTDMCISQGFSQELGKLSTSAPLPDQDGRPARSCRGYSCGRIRLFGDLNT